MTKVLFVRVPDELYDAVEALRLRERRTQNTQAQILIEVGLANYGSAIALPAPREVVSGSPVSSPIIDIKARPQGKTIAAKKSIEQAQKRIDTANEKTAKDGLKKLKKIPKGIEAVDTCEHGFAKGFCKKDECNRKYAK